MRREQTSASEANFGSTTGAPIARGVDYRTRRADPDDDADGDQWLLLRTEESSGFLVGQQVQRRLALLDDLAATAES